MNSKKRHPISLDNSRGIRNVRSRIAKMPQKESETILPLDIWRIIIRFSDCNMLSSYILLSKRYKECIYSLPLEVLRDWIETTIGRKSDGYHFRELGPEGRIQLMYNNRIVMPGAGPLKKKLEALPLLAAVVSKYLAYYDIIRYNQNKNKRLLAIIADSIITHYPYLFRSFSELEKLAISLYTKDEVLLSVYGELFDDYTLVFEGKWYLRDYFWEYSNVRGCPDILTFQNRSFIRLCMDDGYNYIWCESTQIDSFSLAVALGEELDLSDYSHKTVCISP